MPTNQELLKAKIEAVFKALEDVPGLGIAPLRDFINGTMSVTKKTNSLKLPITLPADVLEDPLDVACVLRGEWKVVPLLLFVHADDGDTAKSN